ncbi:hypothetical protein LTR53_009305 [Teratosphaeriaceae sp. CCFEE 6253]|nr:hypothetical protein LTR53_009305 [Teratosphaeriaceae sp. CCFEE 6253]
MSGIISNDPQEAQLLDDEDTRHILVGSSIVSLSTPGGSGHTPIANILDSGRLAASDGEQAPRLGGRKTVQLASNAEVKEWAEIFAGIHGIDPPVEYMLEESPADLVVTIPIAIGYLMDYPKLKLLAFDIMPIIHVLSKLKGQLEIMYLAVSGRRR